MLRILGIIITIILTDFYLFPISLGNTGANTKMLMAAAGVVVLLFDMARHKDDLFNKYFINLSLWAIFVSLCCNLSVIINDTHDYTYADYIISMWVWLFSSYLLVRTIFLIHSKVNIRIISDYLTVVAVIQCIIALCIEYNASVRSFFAPLLFETDRLQGIYALLDPAGIRFSAVLTILGYTIINYVDKKRITTLICYISAFIIIGVVGNMIARTTTVGIAIVFAYWIYSLVFVDKTKQQASTVLKILSILLLVSLPVILFYYNSNLNFQENIRFGFEGFFSLAETGKWEVSSNEILKNMWVLPDNLHTWIIGDGYLENPYINDVYYTGPKWEGYYQDTDIGYLRFIFYFGLIGLVSFIGFFFYATKCCIIKFPENKILFQMLLLLNLIIWCKVSTDIFQFFALFLAIPYYAIENNDKESEADSEISQIYEDNEVI